MSKKEKFLAFIVILCSINICYLSVRIYLDTELTDIAKHFIYAIVNYLIARNTSRAICYGKQGLLRRLLSKEARILATSIPARK